MINQPQWRLSALRVDRAEQRVLRRKHSQGRDNIDRQPFYLDNGYERPPPRGGGGSQVRVTQRK